MARRTASKSVEHRGQRPGLHAARGPRVVVGLLVLAAVLAVHWPVLSAGALTFDDQQFLTDNPLVRHPSWHSAGRFFAEILAPSTVQGYYLPLSMVSLMLDYAAGGRPDHLRPFHRTSLALHVANTALVLLLLHRLFIQFWPAALAALLIGLHPLTVEPVAWVGERKTLLAAFFALLCVWLYVLHAQRPRWSLYGAGLAALLLALLSKPTSVPLPAVLLVLNYWPLRRLSRRTLVELVPFFAIAGAFAVITLISHARTAGLALPAGPALPSPLLLTPYLVVFYVRKIVWPTALTPFYPLPEPFTASQPVVLTSLAVAVVFLGLLAWSWRRTRAAVSGAAIFLLAISPTLGWVHYSWVTASDKYLYLPALGVVMVLTWALAHLWTAPWRRPAPGLRRAATVVTVLLLAGLAAEGTRGQIGRWQTTEGLCRYMLSLAPRAVPVLDDLGTELARQGRWAEAVAHYTRALEIDPAYYKSHNNLAIALVEMNRLDEAATHLQAAVRLKPDYGSAYNTLGTLAARQGRFDEAYAHFARALELDPHIADVHCNVASALVALGRPQEAVPYFQQAIRLRPEFAGAHNNLAVTLAKLGDYAGAAEHFRTALRWQPSHGGARLGLARLLASRNRTAEARVVLEQGLQIAPQDAALRAAWQQLAQPEPTPAPSFP